jgi:ribose 5-phosphate isomerase
VYYSGTEEEWTNITISSYNTSLTDATIYYNSVMSTTAPTATPVPTPKPKNFIVDYDNGTITNDGETSQEATVIIAVYDEGILKDITATEMTFEAGEVKQISIDANTKIFVWDSLKEMQPLTK